MRSILCVIIVQICIQKLEANIFANPCGLRGKNAMIFPAADKKLKQPHHKNAKNLIFAPFHFNNNIM
jgi:hypothetical protein